MTNQLPTNDWSDEQLAAYAKGSLASSSEDEAQYLSIGRRSSVTLFRAGHALFIAHCRHTKTRDFGRWCKLNDLATSSVHGAIKLYEKAKIEAAVEKLTITEAKIKFGIIAKPETKAREPIGFGKGLASVVGRIEGLTSLDRSQVDPQTVNELVDRAMGMLIAFKTAVQAQAA